MSDEPRDPTTPTCRTTRRTPRPGPPQPPTSAGTDRRRRHRLHPGRPPAHHRAHSGQHGLLIAGRVAVALVAVIVLTATGWEWAIKSRADSGIISRSVQAIVTDDSNLATATAAPPPAGSYQAENILLLGSDTRAGAANAAAGGTDESTSDGVANSDSQMIAHVSADRQHVTVLSIPRDTMIDAPDLQDLGRRHRPALRCDLPGQQRRQVAHQLGLLGRRPAMFGSRHPGPDRAEDRPGHRHRLRRIPEHGGRPRRRHGQCLRTDHRR